jgi:DNA-binding XRE family transcriptional regulator
MAISERLCACAEKGQLSKTELAFWIGISRSTLVTWMAGVEPTSFRLPQIEPKLFALEKAIATDERLPIPLSVTQFERRDYLREIQNDWFADRVSSSRSAK